MFTKFKVLRIVIFLSIMQAFIRFIVMSRVSQKHGFQ